MAERSPPSTTGPRRLYIFEIVDRAPPRIVALMDSLPGVHRLRRRSARASAWSWASGHPISLESCQSLFSKENLTLFRGDGEVVLASPAPAFAPVRSLVRTELVLDDVESVTHTSPTGEQLALSLPLRLDTSLAAWRKVVATVVPTARRGWLAKMLYALPPRALTSLRIATTEEAIYLLDPGGIEGLPLGRFYSEIAERVYVPAGMTLVPAVAPTVLLDLLRERGDGHVFFSPDEERPQVIRGSAFGPVSRRVLREIEGTVVHADAPDRYDPPLPMMQYGEKRRFPLWGVPAKKEPATEPAKE